MSTTPAIEDVDTPDDFVVPDVTKVDPTAVSEQREADSEKRDVNSLVERIRLASGGGAKASAGEGSGRGGESRQSPPRQTQKKTTPSKPREGTLVKPLTDIYMAIGTMMVPFDQACAMAIMDNAEDCAKAVEKLARENEAVRRFIMRMLETSAWGGVILAHLPILLIVVVHHGPEQIKDRLAPLAMMMNPRTAGQFMQPQAPEESAQNG